MLDFNLLILCYTNMYHSTVFRMLVLVLGDIEDSCVKLCLQCNYDLIFFDVSSVVICLAIMSLM